MRLEHFEMNSIKKACTEVFGEDAKVYLFGSRTNDQKKGGDIDLLIQKKDIKGSVVEAKIDFLVKLKSYIGEQKVDVLIDAGQELDSVYKTALKEGILL